MKIRSLLIAFLLTQYSLTSFAVNDTLSTANSAANSTNNAQSITFISGPSPVESKARVESTVSPSMGGFSGSFSSDYCGATMQASAGAVGFGFSAGGPKIDSSCIMLRTFERTQQAASSVAPADPVQAAILRKASLEILALIDPKVKEVFEKNGLIGNEANVLKSQPKVVEGSVAKVTTPSKDTAKADAPKNQANSVESKVETNAKPTSIQPVNYTVKNKIETVEQLSENKINSNVERKNTDATPLSDWAQFLKTY